MLPDGMNYRLLVLPQVNTMTPELLAKIQELVAAGATVVGPPALKSPSLQDYPQCDHAVQRLAIELWGTVPRRGPLTTRSYGRGQVISGGPFANRPDTPQVTSRLDTAKWIWLEEGSPANAAPPGARYFRRTLNLPLDRPVASAHLAMTADNRFVCWINGQRAGGSSDFTQAYGMNVTTLVQLGTNLVAVTARNGSN